MNDRVRTWVALVLAGEVPAVDARAEAYAALEAGAYAPRDDLVVALTLTSRLCGFSR